MNLITGFFVGFAIYFLFCIVIIISNVRKGRVHPNRKKLTTGNTSVFSFFPLFLGYIIASVMMILTLQLMIVLSNSGEFVDATAILAFFLTIPTYGLIFLKLTYRMVLGQKICITGEEKYSNKADFLSYNGRKGRFSFVMERCVLYIVFIFVFFMIITGISVSINNRNTSDDTMGLVFAGVSTVMLAILFWLDSLLVVKRFHDLNKSKTYYWLLLVPFFNIYITLLLNFKKGTIGKNKYGPDPIRHEEAVVAMEESFADIPMNIFRYTLVYTYDNILVAREDYYQMLQQAAPSGFKLHIQLRKSKNQGSKDTYLAFFLTNVTDWDHFITSIGEGNYQKGIQLIHSKNYKEYEGQDAYIELFKNTDKLV